MCRTAGLFIAALAACWCVAAQYSQKSPYAAEEKRPIKALSEASVESYLRGEGMGLAKAAELNRYPGPKHVLELKQELKLSTAQVARTQSVFDVMHREAAELGRKIIALEHKLDATFAKGAATEVSTESLSVEIGRLNGKLRHCHLKAHLKMMPILSKWQIAEYSRLRGYGDEEG